MILRGITTFLPLALSGSLATFSSHNVFREEVLWRVCECVSECVRVCVVYIWDTQTKMFSSLEKWLTVFYPFSILSWLPALVMIPQQGVVTEPFLHGCVDNPVTPTHGTIRTLLHPLLDPVLWGELCKWRSLQNTKRLGVPWMCKLRPWKVTGPNNENKKLFSGWVELAKCICPKPQSQEVDVQK